MSSLVLIHCRSDAGYAIDTLGEVFFHVARQVEGSLERVHLAYAALADNRPGFLPEGFEQLFAFDPSIASRRERQRLETYVRTHGIDKVLAFDMALENRAIAPLRRGGVCRLVSYWGAPMSSIHSGLKLLAKRVEVRLRRRRPDHFVFESEAMRETAVRGRGVPLGETSVVRLSVDLERFRPPEGAMPVHPEDLSIPPGHLVVFYSGHMEARKGVAVIMDAAKQLVDVWDDRRFHFLLCGNKGSEAEPYLARLKGSDARRHVTFAGYREDVPLLMRASYVGVIASTGWDSFTMSAVEMAASGLPLVVSDLQGLRETVVPQVSGVLFPPGDHVALARALQGLADHPELREKMSVAARRRAVTEYSQEKQIASLARILIG